MYDPAIEELQSQVDSESTRRKYIIVGLTIFVVSCVLYAAFLTNVSTHFTKANFYAQGEKISVNDHCNEKHDQSEKYQPVTHNSTMVDEYGTINRRNGDNCNPLNVCIVKPKKYRTQYIPLE